MHARRASIWSTSRPGLTLGRTIENVMVNYQLVLGLNGATDLSLRRRLDRRGLLQRQ